MASKRHSTQPTARCKAPSPNQINWRCHRCDKPAGQDGALAITRRAIRQLTRGRTTHGHWRTWCRPCAVDAHGTMAAFRRSHDHIPLAVVATQAHIDAETIRRANTWAATWMGQTNWAHITTAGGTEKAAAA